MWPFQMDLIANVSGLLSGKLKFDEPWAWSMPRLVDFFTGSGPVTARIMLFQPRRSKDLN